MQMRLKRLNVATTLVGLAAGAILAMPGMAYALQTVQVGPSGAILFASASPNAKMTGTLRPGQRVRIFETPTGGYFHVLFGKKYVGWVQQTALNLPHPESERAAPAAAAAPSAAPQAQPEVAASHRPLTWACSAASAWPRASPSLGSPSTAGTNSPSSGTWGCTFSTPRSLPRPRVPAPLRHRWRRLLRAASA